ncbi:alpha/beta fold hydrolase, partial [Allorhizobium taibaishanense]
MNILLISGFMASNSLWDDVVSDFASIGAVTYADLSEGNSISEMAAKALISAPDKFVAVGFSMGGYIAREMARMASHRTSGLVLIATSARSDTPEQAAAKAMAVNQLQVSQFAGLSRTVNRRGKLTPYRRPILTPMLTISTWVARRWPG